MSTIYVGAALTVIMLGVVAWAMYDARLAASQLAQQQTSNIALTVERDIGRAVNILDLSLRAAVKGMAITGIAGMSVPIRQSILFDGAIAAEGFGGIGITDDQGNLIYNSTDADRAVISVADREYFQAHRQRNDLDLLITHPIQVKSDGHWSLALARRIDNPDGSFRGVAVGTLNLSLFQDLFATLALGTDGSVSLLNVDGVLIDRLPRIGRDIGQAIGGSEFLRQLSQRPDGSFEKTSTVDHVSRLYSYRRVGNLPLVVTVGFASRDVYADWVRKVTLAACLLLLLTSLSAAMALALRRELGRRMAAELSAANSNRQCSAALTRLNTLFRHSEDAMLVAKVLPDGGFVYEAVNPVWEDLAGVPAAFAVGCSPATCLSGQPAETVLRAWRACVREKAVQHYNFPSPRPDDPREWEASVVPIVDSDGSIHRLIAVARDMTARNTLERSLREAQRMEAVGQLTAGVAHDFNNLLQAMLGALEVLRDQPELNDEGRHCVSIAEGAGRRGATLVHRLLAFSRKQVLHPEGVQPQTVLGGLMPLLAHVLGDQIRVELETDAASWQVWADVAQLENCLLNLAINARDAMSGHGVLRLHACNVGADAAREHGLPAQKYTRFSVQDEGVGMPPETLSRAMEPFFTTKAIGKGTGLGLSMVLGFARQSGGDVTIVSIPGQGTTVSLWLPGSDAAQIVGGDAAEAIPCDTDRGHGRVLIVDDEAAVREMLAIFLIKDGFTVTTATSGDEALQLLRSADAWDLLVADQSMPGLTGSELISEAARLRPGLPTMLITGYDKVSGLDCLAGRVTVLRKPFKRVTFLSQVQALLTITLVGAVGVPAGSGGDRPAASDVNAASTACAGNEIIRSCGPCCKS